jgi:hypothetical protein
LVDEHFPRSHAEGSHLGLGKVYLLSGSGSIVGTKVRSWAIHLPSDLEEFVDDFVDIDGVFVSLLCHVI